jgi:3-hydroxy-D-aspartate aldolase
VSDSVVSASRKSTPTPALVLDLDAFERNVNLMAEKARKWGVSLRPHAKAHKSAEIAHRQVKAGALGVTCATLGEAELMARSGIPSILVSSPIVTDVHISRLMAMQRGPSEILVVVDDILSVQKLSEASRLPSRPLSVLVDFDVGQHRTGCTSIEQACRLASAVCASSGLKFRGIQAYAGHIQHVEDVVQRRCAAQKVQATVQDLIDSLRAIGLEPGIRTGSGTGTADFDGPAAVFTELQVGSYIFMDVEYLSIRWPSTAGAAYAPALFVDTTVVSVGWSDHVTTDAGLKAFSQGGLPPRLLNVDQRVKYTCDSDEHGYIVSEEAACLPALGARMTCVVPHCDPTVSLYQEYLCVRDGVVVSTWPIEPRR